MFREDLQTVSDVQEKIRSHWKWYEKCVVERGMDVNRAVDQAYGVGQGIITVLTYEVYDEVFSDEFREEWEEWRCRMLFGED